MATISKLDVVNECLKLMAEPPVNSLVNEDHPYISAALQSLELARIRELSTGWWFNTEYATLQKDTVTGRTNVPETYLDCDPIDEASPYVVRGRYLYDRVNQTYDLADSEVQVRLYSDIPFEDLPITMQMYVMYSTVLDFSNSFDADQQRVQAVSAFYVGAHNTVKAQHIRNSNVNFLTNGSTGNKLANIAWPGATTIRARSRYGR